MRSEQVRLQIENLKLQCPDIFEGDDEQLFADMIEGTTDAKEFLQSIDDRTAEDEELIAAIKSRESALKLRRERIEARIEARRKLMLDVVKATGRSKFELPTSTLSIRKGGMRAIVTDPDAVPDEFLVVTKRPALAKIKEHLEFTGGAANWATLVRSDDTLTLRRQ